MDSLQRFQFHKGTIRTLCDQKAYHSIGLFQFHKGTIRTFKRRFLDITKKISIP